MGERRFPILGPRPPGCPPSVPWEVVEHHEAQAQRNHGQSLARLAERHGLACCELVAVLDGRDWHRMDDAAAVARLKELLETTGGTP